MNKVTLNVISKMTCIKCDCGGYFTEPKGNVFLSDPTKQEYICNKCGGTTILNETEFPHIEYELGNELGNEIKE